MTTRIEVIGRISGHRHCTVEQKMGMLRDAFGPDGWVLAVMECREVSSGKLSTLRHEAMSGALRSSVLVIRPAFAEVQAAEVAPIDEPLPALSALTSLPPVASSPCESSRICIELPTGFTLHIDAGVDTDALSRVDDDRRNVCDTYAFRQVIYRQIPRTSNIAASLSYKPLRNVAAPSTCYN